MLFGKSDSSLPDVPQATIILFVLCKLECVLKRRIERRGIRLHETLAKGNALR